MTAATSSDSEPALGVSILNPRRQVALLTRLGCLRSTVPLDRALVNPEHHSQRILQLLSLGWAFSRCSFERQHQAIIFGEGLRFLNGPIELSAHDVTRRTAHSLLTGQPVLTLRATHENPLQSLSRALGIDDTGSIRGIISPNPALVLFAEHNGRPVVLHLLESEAGTLSGHSVGMRLGRAAINHPGGPPLIPELIDHEIRDGVEFLMETRLPGRPLHLDALSDQQLAQSIDAAMRPLDALFSSGTRGGAQPDEIHITKALAGVVQQWPRYGSDLRASLAALSSWSRGHLASVLVHGDYWLGNILWQEDPLEISGIIDWDCARENGCAGYDAVHLVLVSFAMQRKCSLGHSLRALWSQRITSPAEDRLLRSVEARFHLLPGDLEYLAALVWLTVIWQRRHIPREMTWEDDMIGDVARAFLAWHHHRA